MPTDPAACRLIACEMVGPSVSQVSSRDREGRTGYSDGAGVDSKLVRRLEVGATKCHRPSSLVTRHSSLVLIRFSNLNLRALRHALTFSHEEGRRLLSSLHHEGSDRGNINQVERSFLIDSLRQHHEALSRSRLFALCCERFCAAHARHATIGSLERQWARHERLPQAQRRGHGQLSHVREAIAIVRHRFQGF